jgi:hypothetical protein
MKRRADAPSVSMACQDRGQEGGHHLSPPGPPSSRPPALTVAPRRLPRESLTFSSRGVHRSTTTATECQVQKRAASSTASVARIGKVVVTCLRLRPLREGGGVVSEAPAESKLQTSSPLPLRFASVISRCFALFAYLLGQSDPDASVSTPKFFSCVRTGPMSKNAPILIGVGKGEEGRKRGDWPL